MESLRHNMPSREYVISRTGSDPFDMSVPVRFPYSYYSIPEDDFFPKYKAGTPMTWGQLIHLETIGLYTLSKTGYMIVDENTGLFVVMDDSYALNSGHKYLIDNEIENRKKGYEPIPLYSDRIMKEVTQVMPELDTKSLEYCVEQYKAYLATQLH